MECKITAGEQEKERTKNAETAKKIWLRLR
jgi:hypothetical protein